MLNHFRLQQSIVVVNHGIGFTCFWFTQHYGDTRGCRPNTHWHGLAPQRRTKLFMNCHVDLIKSISSRSRPQTGLSTLVRSTTVPLTLAQLPMCIWNATHCEFPRSAPSASTTIDSGGPKYLNQPSTNSWNTTLFHFCPASDLKPGRVLHHPKCWGKKM